MALHCHQFAYHDDNYGFLLHDDATGATAAIDAGCSDSYLAALAETGYRLTHIFITHHHWDHTDGLARLKQATGARSFGPHNTKDEIAALLDERVTDGDHFAFGAHEVSVIATPGHTLDMMNFYLKDAGFLFSGDSLFTLGCGRLFEGDGAMMWHSLTKLLALPDETVIYSAHEYGLANAAFAEVIDPDNLALKTRIAALKALRDKGLATVPSLLSEERATNPFCRADDASLRTHLGMLDASDEAVFSEVRRRKDVF